MGNESTQAPTEDKQTPRQPHNLAGLIAWSNSYADNTRPSNVQPMSEERREWLRAALDSLTVDEVEVLKKDLKVLSEGFASTDSQQLISDRENALDNIQTIVEGMDMAADFMKINGYPTILQMLHAPEATLRAKAANVVATLVQNNPFCQQIAIAEGTMHVLFSLLSDSDNMVRKKAMYALSALVRNFEPAHSFFLEQGGLDILKGCMVDSNAQVRLKSLFLLKDLCSSEEKKDTKTTVGEHGFLQLLVTLVTDEDSTVREQALSTLALLVEDNPVNQSICRAEELGLRRNLEIIQQHVANGEDSEEANDFAKQLFSICFS